MQRTPTQRLLPFGTALAPCLLALLVLAAATARAQEGAEPDPVEEPALAVEARELRERLAGELGKIDEFLAELRSASGEERLVLLEQVGELEAEILADFDRLIEKLEEQEREGLDTAELRSFVRKELGGAAPYLRQVVAETRSQLAQLGRTREKLAADELLAFESRMAQQNERIDHYYEMVLGHVDRMDRVGIESSSLRRFLNDALVDRADSLSGRVQLTRSQISELRARTEEAPDDTAARDQLRAAERKLEWTTQSLASTADVLDAVGIPTSEYRQLMIQATGTITEDIFDTEVAFGLANEGLASAASWARERAPTLVFRVLLFFLIVAVFRVLGGLVRRLIQRGFAASKGSSQLLRDVLVSITGNAMVVLGVLIGLSQIGIEIGPLLAGIGIVGFIVGFALQDTLGNFASGAMILIYRPFDVGDTVEAAGGVLGTVERMSLVTTTIMTFDNQTLVVPNSKIWGDVIRNITAQERRRVDLVFGVSYSDDIRHVEQVLDAVVQSHPKVLEDPAPRIKVHELGDSSVDFIVRPWVKSEDYWDVYWDLTREVKLRFDQEGISIPFPQRDVHVVTPGTSGG